MQRPNQVWDLCRFGGLNDWVAAAPFSQRAQIFQSRFRSYLFGSGTPESPPGEHLEEPANTTISATVIRASALLTAMTECGDLPADPDYRIQVRFFTHTSYFSSRSQFNWFSVGETTIPTLAIHTCTGAIDVFLTQELEDIMMDHVDTAPFDHWIHQQLLCSRSFYNRI